MKKQIYTLIIGLLASTSLFSQAWIARANFAGVARYHAVGFSIGTVGYIGTGNTTGPVNRDFWAWDQATDTWTQMADFGGVARHAAMGFSIGNRGYLGGGEVNSANHLTDFWAYDPPPTNNWTQVANLPGGARTSPTGFSIGGMGYFGLGQSLPAVDRNDFWEYDPALDTWTQKANFAGAARYGAQGFGIGTNGYVGLGYAGAYMQDFWEYTPGAGVMGGSWQQKANFGGGIRGGTIGFSVGSRGYIGLGTNGALQNDFWEYTPAAGVMGGTWTQLCNFSGAARVSAVGFAINNVGYVGTGNTGAAQNDFWELQASCGGALPIELLSFSANWQDEKHQAAVIEWQTANEKNNDYFEIQRSIDAVNFNTIMQVDGAGTTTQTINYQELDTEPYKDGTSYYRLKQVDFDGTFSYSQVEVLSTQEGLEIISLYPNPVYNNLRFNLFSSINTEATVNIYNTLGQIVQNKSLPIKVGTSNIELDAEKLMGGNYYIEITTGDKKYSAQRKFIVSNKN